MKKGLLCILFALLLTAQGFADVIIEPENKFFKQHYDECEFIGQTYQAIRDTDICTQPGGAVVGVLKKGERVAIQYVYFDKDGYCHGLYYNSELKVDEDLWINLGDTEIAYDERVFYAQYEEKLKDATDEMSTLDFTKDMYIYTYPGSDSYIHHHFTDEPFYDKVFTDENGADWLRIAAGWINLDAPHEKAEPIDREVPDDYQPITRPIREGTAPKDNYVINYVIAGALVVAACVIAFVMICKKYPKE